VPLTRVPIDKFVGVDRSAAEGETLAPKRVFNASFKREGAITVLGGAAFDITGIRTDANVLAYDESTLALLDTPGVWTNNLSVLSLTASEFRERNLTLIPRGGVVTEFTRVGNNFSGRALVRSPQNEFQELSDAPAIVITSSAGGTIGNGVKFDVVCVVEAPTDAGLLTYGVSEEEFTTTSSNQKLKFELADVLPPSHVARFYWRTTQDRYAALAELVSDGIDEIEFEINAVPVHVPTEDAILNFAPYRAEIHEGRVFGVASDRSFLSIVPDSVIKRRDAYFQRSIQDDKTQIAFSTNDAGSVMRASGDFLIWRIRRMEIIRKTEGASVIVPLARLRHAADLTKEMNIFMEYPEAGGRPLIKVDVDGDVAEGIIPPPGIPSLGESAGSQVAFDSFDLELDILSVSGTTVQFGFSVVAAGTSSVIASVTFSGTFAAWSGWEATAVTNVSLFGAPNARPSFSVKWSQVRSNTIVPSVDSFSANVLDYASGLSWTSSSAAAETWTSASANDIVVLTYIVEGAGDIEFSQPRMTLIFSDAGYANRGTDLNYFVLSASNSAEITALASTPAGLLIFMNNETWLLSGNVDPFFTAISQSPQARIQRFSGTIGCDRGVIPGRLGGVVFPIYKGELYSVTLGMGDVDFGSGLQPIGRPINLREDPIVQVVGEPQTNHVVVRTRGGLVYRYDTQTGQWVDDPFTGAGEGAIDLTAEQTLVLMENNDNIAFENGGLLRSEATPDNNRIVMIPACLCATYGTRFLVKDRFGAIDFNLRDKVSVKWEALTLGDKTLEKLWRRVELKTSASYAGVPKMIYSLDGGASETVSAVSSGNGKWVFNFKRGAVGAAADVEFEFENFNFEDTFTPPITFEIATRNRSRGRVG
jgi:hypothetical protein